MKLYAFADEAARMIDGQIAAMVRNGLDGVEIRGVDGTSVSDITPEKAGEVRRKLDAAGLTVWSVGSPIGKIKLAEDDFEAHMEKFRNTLQVAEILGAKNIRVFSFYLPKDEPAERYEAEVIRRLRLMVAEAAQRGIDLCHENEKGIYGENADRCLALFEQVPGLKGVFDPANFVQCGQNTKAAWEKLSSHIKYLHIKDAVVGGKVVPAGKGAGNIPWVLEQFRAMGGTAVSVEPHLTVFDGLAALEQSGRTSEVDAYAYPTADAAFDAACDALKELL